MGPFFDGNKRPMLELRRDYNGRAPRLESRTRQTMPVDYRRQGCQTNEVTRPQGPTEHCVNDTDLMRRSDSHNKLFQLSLLVSWIMFAFIFWMIYHTHCPS